MKLRLAAFALMLQLAASVAAADANLAVAEAWIRAAPPNAPLAAYMTLENRSDVARILVSASSSDFGQITLHRTERAAGSSSMTQLTAAVIPAHGKLVFGPGGYHLMLEQPRHPLRTGESLAMTLRLADGSAVPVQFEVRDLRATAEDRAARHGTHSMGGMHGEHQ